MPELLSHTPAHLFVNVSMPAYGVPEGVSLVEAISSQAGTDSCRPILCRPDPSARFGIHKPLIKGRPNVEFLTRSALAGLHKQILS